MSATLLRAAALSCAALMATDVAGEDIDRSAVPMPPFVQAAMPGIGKVGYVGIGSKTACTGALVSPLHVLTANHCLRSYLPALAVTFTAGASLDDASQWTRGARVIRMETVDGEFATDVALVELREPMEEIDIIPLADGPVDPFASDLAFIGYARDDPERLTGRLDCLAFATKPGLIETDCAVVVGHSGAPLLVQQGGELRLVGTVVARRSGLLETSIAVPLPDEFRAVIEEALGT
ncbi:MAG: serine protease [Pseudomonadota bacterium]